MIEKINDKLYSWASIMEHGTREQARKTSLMPFVYPHIAIMPDCHVGKGACVGMVLPTLHAIIPAAVGVDIGCFRGDTRIPLLNGRQRTLQDLAEENGRYWVYSADENGRVVPGRARALRTRTDAPLIRVIISGGDEVICTPDHRFMMNDGTYRIAQDLRFDDSLMSLRWTEEGYESISTRKVITVEHLDERADVYCLQVEKYHNFALAAGVFVHNCGMMAVRTQFTEDDIQDVHDFPYSLAELRVSIEKAVPLSAGNYNQSWWRSRARIAELEKLEGCDHAEEISPNWRLQLGSLGSGNHFIEVSLDEEARVWLFLHSGSRGVGNRLASKHIRIAQQVCADKSRGKVVLPDRDLAYLEEGDPEFWEYITDLRWAQHFALLNRDEMMDRVISCFGEWMKEAVRRDEVIRCHHNYTVQESHYGQVVWLSRKGAIDASEGRPGLIPGSMGDASYVVEGKGSAQSLNSSPHGAGRNYSRGEAKRTFTVEQLEESMQGIEWNRDHGRAFLDEISGAYKPIDQVMKDSEDLVTVRHTLHQIVNVKGDLRNMMPVLSCHSLVDTFRNVNGGETR